MVYITSLTQPPMGYKPSIKWYEPSMGYEPSINGGDEPSIGYITLYIYIT